MDALRKGIAIGMLFGSEGHGNLITKTATENGIYTAAEEIDPETGEIFDPPKDGYSVFTVDLALDDKSVSLTTSQITGSQTAVFEYDPHSENPELEGYSLFTIDLSGVKDDIEDMLARIAALEDELEDCHDYKAEVVAKLQEYDPNFDPQTCEDIVDEIDDVYQKGKDDEKEEEPPGFDFPEGVDIPDIMPFLDKDDIVTPEGNSYSFNYYVIEGIEQKRYPVNYKFEPMVEGKRFQLQGFCDIIDNSTGTVVSALGITGAIDISSNRDVSWQIIKNEIDYTAKKLVTTAHFREGAYEVDWVTRNNILLYLDTTSPNPRYNVRNG